MLRTRGTAGATAAWLVLFAWLSALVLVYCILRRHKIQRGTVKWCHVYSAFEEAVKPNRSPIKLSLWSACYFTRWTNEGRESKMKHSPFLFIFLFLHIFMSPSWQALSWEGLQRNRRLNVEPATQGLTAPRGLRPPSTSFVPLGGSVQQDQRLDIRQVHITSPGVRLGQEHTSHGGGTDPL